MSCSSCRTSIHQPEYYRRFKPESNSGCGAKNSNDCSSPSNAAAGSPRQLWEEEYGKLVTNITKKLGDDGRYFLEIIRTPCGKPNARQDRKGCCSLRYRVAR